MKATLYISDGALVDEDHLVNQVKRQLNGVTGKQIEVAIKRKHRQSMPPILVIDCASMAP